MLGTAGSTFVLESSAYTQAKVNLHSAAYLRDATDYDDLLEELKRRVCSLRILLYSLMYRQAQEFRPHP